MTPNLSLPRAMMGHASVLALGIACLTGGCGERGAKEFVRPKPVMVFQPREMTDSLHALIAAHRQVYASNVVQRLGFEAGAIRVESHGETNDAVLPGHLLRLVIPNVAARGVEFHCVGRSLWPIDPRGAPATDTERRGLEALARNSSTNFYAEESLGGRRYFTAVYADRAVVPACVSCHNAHPQSPRKDFKPGDVMGGIVVRVPLEL